MNRSLCVVAPLLAVLLALGACSSEDPSTPIGSEREPAPATSNDDVPPDDPSAVDASTPAEEVDALAPDSAVVKPDPCASKTPVCPPTSAKEGGGLVAIDRCAFPMFEATSFKTLPPIVDALAARTTKAPLTTVLADLNRSGTALAASAVPGGPAGVTVAFGWNAEDDASTAWTPQGMTGSADADVTGLVAGRRLVVVSFYNDAKGVRIAFVDVTNPKAPSYRFALLVQPTGSPQAPDFAPVSIHAGGMAWIGNLLYVADTGRGFRVFDLSRILQVPTDVDQIGCSGGTCRGGTYRYVVPQIGAYSSKSKCDLRFSFVALDRSTSPASLVSGEYCNGTTACTGALAGRVVRWPLVNGSRLAGGTSWASEAWLMGQRQVQGAVARKGLFFFSSSAPGGTGGALYRVKGKASATSRWIDMPEDLMVDEQNDLLWSLSEAPGERAVIGARLASYPAP